MAIIARLRRSGPPGKRRGRRLRYVQTLPTLCTLGNLLCGFGAIHLCLRAMRFAGDASAPLEVIARNSQLMERLLPTHIVMAAYLIFLAMIFDALDGRLARLTRHTSDFGAQLDSLADVVSFGVAPAMIIMALLGRHVPAPDPAIPWIVAPASQHPLGRIIWFMAAVYVACAALRLARFNVETQPDEQSHMNFLGLPTPGAAAAMASMVILHDHLYLYDRAGAKAVAEHGGWFSDVILWSLPILAPLIGLLMVSRFRYVHVVNRYLRGRRSFADIVKSLFVVAAVVIYPEVTLALAAVGYALSGVALALIEKLTAPGGEITAPRDAPAQTPRGRTG